MSADVCQYCKLPLEGQKEHSTGLDCLDAMEADRDRLRALADGYRAAVERLNTMLELRNAPQRPWGWYREITPGTFTVEKGDWPPPEPDDVAWLPLYEHQRP